MAKRRISVKKRKPRKTASSGVEFFGDLKTALMVAGLLVLVGVAGTGVVLWRSGWVEEKTSSAVTAMLDVTAHTGFSVQDIVVEGRTKTEKEQILNALDVERGMPILGFSPHNALTRIQDIPWVRNGVVERRLPQTIYVRLYEREPMAIWQINKQYKLIDNEGHVLQDIEQSGPMPLPVVVGEGANEHAANLLGALSTQRNVFERVKASVRVGNRRWDLHMDNGVVVKLPEERVDRALDRLARVMREQNILDRKILGIDLRLPDRMVIPTEEEIDPPKNSKKSKT